MIYLKLFFAFLQIGMFSFGGGYAAMPLIQHQVVDTYHWLDGKGFADLVTISQMTPGPIATNAATFVGMNTAGLAGLYFLPHFQEMYRKMKIPFRHKQTN